MSSFRRLNRLSLLVLFLSFFCDYAFATPVTWSFSGNINFTRTTQSTTNFAHFGDIFSGIITLEESQLVVGSHFSNNDPLFGFGFEVNGHSFSTFGAEHEVTGLLAGGKPYFQIQTNTFGTIDGNSYSFVQPVLVLSNEWNNGIFYFQVAFNTDDGQPFFAGNLNFFSGTLPNVTPIPLPTSQTLLVIALFSIACWKWIQSRFELNSVTVRKR